MEKEALLGRKFLAFLIDLIIVNLLVLIPFQPVFSSMVPADNRTFIETYNYISNNQQLMDSLTPTLIIMSIVSALAMLFYLSIMEYTIQQSVGEMIVMIKVKTKGKLSFKSCIIRNLTPSFLLVSPLSLLYYIDLIHLLIYKQRLTEIWSNTWVEKY